MGNSLLRFAAGAAILVVVLALPSWAFRARYGRLIATPAEAPQRPVALVFGAGLRRDGSPTTVLADRVRTAAELYRQGKVQLLILSGSDASRNGDETLAMRSLAIELGVPAESIRLDPYGHRTFATCERALSIYGVRRALLVTQAYHLPRALATCRMLGIDASGVAADLHAYGRRSMAYWRLREIPASFVAIWESLLHPTRRASLPPAQMAQEPTDTRAHES
jgi:vancomycin permeability regulator SanA